MSSERQIGEAGLEGERGRIRLHCWLWHRSVFMRFSARSFTVCSSVLCFWRCAGSPPSLQPFSTLVGSSQIAAKAKICCCSQMDGESV